mgnify:CR=1 FL=1
MSPRISIVLTVAVGLAGAYSATFIGLRVQARTPAADAVHTIRIGGHPQEVLDFPERHLIISKSCRKADGKLECEAFDAFARAADFHLKSSEHPAQQADKICSITRGKKVVSGDVAYCQYPDGSLIDTASLYSAAKSGN